MGIMAQARAMDACRLVLIFVLFQITIGFRHLGTLQIRSSFQSYAYAPRRPQRGHVNSLGSAITRNAVNTIRSENDPVLSGKSLILSGPSGAGKGVIMEELMRRSPGRYELCVSHTSRSPRHGEVNGTHYFFVTKEFMQDEINKNDEYVEGQSALNYKFLEYAEVHGNLYGTSVDSVRSIHERDKVAILDVDTIGVEGIHKLNIVPAKYVFIAPPSLQELEVRLRKRGTEAEEQINLRLKNAVGQMEFGINSEIFDYILENDDLTTAVDELSKKLEEWGLMG